jgi:ElaB/YqjD/DUF883 family membrane-anchored ribosome-binding protein
LASTRIARSTAVRAPSFAETLVDSLADRIPDDTTEQVEAVLAEARHLADEVLEEARLRAEVLLAEAKQRGAAALEEAAVRGGAAWDALRGERVGPPVGAARWPWAVAAAVAGAAAGIAVAVVLRRVAAPDPPGAQDPEELEAVIDRPV